MEIENSLYKILLVICYFHKPDDIDSRFLLSWFSFWCYYIF